VVNDGKTVAGRIEPAISSVDQALNKAPETLARFEGRMVIYPDAEIWIDSLLEGDGQAHAAIARDDAVLWFEKAQRQF